MEALVDFQHTARHFCFCCNISGSFSELEKTKVTCSFFDELRSLFRFALLYVQFTKIFLDLNGVYRTSTARNSSANKHVSRSSYFQFS